MALNLEEYQRLKYASLLELYEQHESVWNQMAIEAYNYTKGYILPPAPVRPDDVVKALIPAISVSQKFIDYTHDKKLREKYWATWFADLILDACWKENVIGGT
jgi:hypothetical protein